MTTDLCIQNRVAPCKRENKNQFREIGQIAFPTYSSLIVLPSSETLSVSALGSACPADAEPDKFWPVWLVSWFFARRSCSTRSSRRSSSRTWEGRDSDLTSFLEGPFTGPYSQSYPNLWHEEHFGSCLSHLNFRLLQKAQASRPVLLVSAIVETAQYYPYIRVALAEKL